MDGNAADLGPLYEFALGTACPGPGRVAFRVAPEGPESFPASIGIAITDRGTVVTCRSDRDRQRAEGVLTPGLLACFVRGDDQAAEALARRSGAAAATVHETFHAQADLFRPQCAWPVWRFEALCDAPDPATSGPDMPPTRPEWQLSTGQPYGVLTDQWRTVSRGALLDWPGRDDLACVIDLYTEPDYRGRGLAKSVASAITTDVLSRGKHALYMCSQANAPSVAVCLSLGYRRLVTTVCVFDGVAAQSGPAPEGPPRRVQHGPSP
jgi:hypothetical protein